MARRTVRVTIPSRSPSKLLKLASDIIKKFKSDAASPLNPERMDQFETKKDDAQTKREQSQEANRTSQALMQQAYTAMGIGEGQTAATPGTLYNLLLLIRDQLLLAYAGNEEKLSEYGFNVVVSSNTPGGGSDDGTDDVA